MIAPKNNEDTHRGESRHLRPGSEKIRCGCCPRTSGQCVLINFYLGTDLFLEQTRYRLAAKQLT